MVVCHWESQVRFPFVYLDSSHIIRSGEMEIKQMTRKQLRKTHQTFERIFAQMKLNSLNANLYYEKLVFLKAQQKLSTLITMETFNPIVLDNALNTIFLFGKALSHNYNNIVFWGENVNFNLYNAAAMSISNAECIIADADFFTLSVGRELQKYISSTCTLIVSTSNTNMPKIDGTYIECELPSIELVHHLSFL